MTPLSLRIACLLALAAAPPAPADTFGSGANAFTIDFVPIGNAGNAADATGYGAVAYKYNMGTYAVSQNQMNLAAANGFTNASPGWWSGDEPVAYLTWYKAAAFVNWLNTSTGHPAAYNLNPGATALTLWQPGDAGYDPANPYRKSNAWYFLPSEDEFYKAAYYDPNANAGAGSYWLYATGSNSIPVAVATGTAGTAVYNNLAPRPAPVSAAGGLSPYATMGQSGNVFQWLEGAWSGGYSTTALRALRGGFWSYAEGAPEAVGTLQSTSRGYSDPANSFSGIGFRVARLADTDNDGIPDQFETGTGTYASPEDTGTSPTSFDTDGDGLNDGAEVNTHHSNPNVADTDGDGFDDGFEVETGFNPTSPTSTPDTLSSIRTAAEYRFNAANGISYRIEASTDLANWTTIETPVIGTGGVITRFYSIEGQPKRYFRSRRN